VLIVEDDPMVAEGITAALAGEGLVARAVHSGREALVLVERFEPDLLLLDIRLPDADGRDIYDQLAKLRPDLPVIFSTGHVLETEFENYLRRPNVGFLLKPYRIDELLKTIIKVVS
jgi:CheY-like chemotaxis protein